MLSWSRRFVARSRVARVVLETELLNDVLNVGRPLHLCASPLGMLLYWCAVQLRCLFRCSSANCSCWYVVVLVRCSITLLLFIVLITPIITHDMLRSRSMCVGNVLMCCACEVCYYITDAAVGGTALISLHFLRN